MSKLLLNSSCWGWRAQPGAAGTEPLITGIGLQNSNEWKLAAMRKRLRKWTFRLRCWLIWKLAGDMEVGINLIVGDIYHDRTRPCYRRNMRIIQRSNYWLKMMLEKKSIWN
jgi:hypothetical protein